MKDNDPKEVQNTKQDRYSRTVFLPNTDFPMLASLPQKEPEILKKWQDTDLQGKLRAHGNGKPKYVLHDGPPYANGNIHIGHAVNKILKDVIIKSWTMMGYDAPYVPGWDCHGLPIEWKIEEKYREEGKNKDDVDILAFRDECRKFAQEWVDIQSAQFQRLGVTGDWKNPYRTMTYRAESAIVQEIHKFALNDGLYKSLKPVMWSTVEKTALAEAEVEYHEHKSITVWVKFPVAKSSCPDLHGTNIVIWTTTPWTLPSNRAIAYGGFEYAVIVVEEISEGSKAKIGDRLVVSSDLLKQICSDAKITAHKTIKIINGDDLKDCICEHSLKAKGYEYSVPLLFGDFVKTDTGTGFVHMAPAHGEDDFILCRAHGIEVTDNVTDEGKFRAHVPLFAGMEIYDKNGKMAEGNFAPIKALEEAGMLLAKGSIKHDYPHSWRSKAPVIFRATPQWFIAMDKPFVSLEGKESNKETLRNVAISSIKKTHWFPQKGETRITSMIENRPDWCISRQRAWGVPIALFLNKETGKVLIDKSVFKTIADYFEKEGADAWWARDPQDFLGEKYDSNNFEQVFDIVDVWFESGSTHAFVLGDTLTWPYFENVQQADLYLEGSDQHRGWFHSSLLESCGTNGYAPYKNVLTHGFVLDEKGYKMSKSLGNVVDPLKVMEQHGADIIRLWVMMSDYAEDIRIGKDTLKNTGDVYRRIRNTLRFLLGVLHDFTPEERIDLSDQNVPELEKYILHLLGDLNDFVKDSIEKNDYGKIVKRLHDFCNSDLSAFYFDIRKDRLYCDTKDLYERRACRTVMAEIFSFLSAWFAPILCFTTEEAWQHRPKDVYGDPESIHLRELPVTPLDWKNQALSERWQEIQQVRNTVSAALEPFRKEKIIGSSLEASPEITLSKDYGQNIDFAEICITSTVTIKTGKNLEAKFLKAEGHKCERCRKVLPEVDEARCLCKRCDKAVKN